MKRATDLTFSIFGLVILSPLFLFIAAAIKLSDRGPVFYRQARVGRGGRPFFMLKFRSMINGADRGSALTIGGDSRITRVGAVIRRCKIDELPQLWNVFAGEMSLVGPRPEVARYVDCYSPEQRKVLDLNPGITDPSSFAFFDESELLSRAEDPERFYVERLMPEKIRINLDYGKRAGFFSDLLLIVATVLRMVGLRLDIFRILAMELPRVHGHS